jgi:hypothetical protein
MIKLDASSGLPRSPLRSVVDLGTVVNVEDVYRTAVLVDPADDAIRAAPRAVTTGEWPEQRLADAIRVDRKCSIAELQHGGGNGFREPRAVLGESGGGQQAASLDSELLRALLVRACGSLLGQLLTVATSPVEPSRSSGWNPPAR